MQLLEPGKLILATEATFPPYEMPAPDGAGIADTGLDGIDIAIAVEIADRLGLQLEIHDIPFDDALYAPANGKADLVMAAMRVSPEREAFMLHSEPYAPADLVLITSDSVNPKREYDYREKQFGAVENTVSWVNCMDQFGEKRTTVFQSNAEAVQAVLDGKIDAFMLDRAPAETIVDQVDGLVIIDKPFYKGDYAIWMAQDNTGLQKAVNDALAAMEDDGTLQAILERYIPNPGL
jgi:polar amino acid transport system substrate-binding protein